MTALVQGTMRVTAGTTQLGKKQLRKLEARLQIGPHALPSRVVRPVEPAADVGQGRTT